MLGLYQRKSSACRAITLVELLVASGVMVILLMALMPVLSSSVRAWHRNSQDTIITMDLTVAMRRIVSELRNARVISINGAGTSINYTLPDGTTGSFSLNNGNLMWSGSDEPLISGVVTSDPEFGGSYRLFELTWGGTTRAVTVRLCVEQNTPVGVRRQRLQELVVLRNQ